MSDTNDMRREFEAWYYEIENVSMRCERLHDLTIRRDAFFATWQAATERAAKAVEAMTERRRMNSSQKLDCEYAAAIRQGGAK